MSYIGTKIINAEPMTRGAYNIFRGWAIPPDERAEEAGFLVEYLDGGKPNLASHAGYVTWTPKEAFDKAYRPQDAMTFGLAIEAMRKGLKVARAGWNGKGMWIGLVAGDQWGLGSNAPFDYSGAPFGSMLPWIGMKTADEKFVPWLASQSDMLAEDWQIVN